MIARFIKMKESDVIYLEFIEQVITDANLLIIGLNLETKNAKLLMNTLKVLHLSLEAPKIATKCMQPLFEVPPKFMSEEIQNSGVGNALENSLLKMIKFAK